MHSGNFEVSHLWLRKSLPDADCGTVRRNQQRQDQAAAQAALNFPLIERVPLTQSHSYNTWNDARKLSYPNYDHTHDITLGTGQVYLSSQAAFCSSVSAPGSERGVNGANMLDFGYPPSDPEIMVQPHLSTHPPESMTLGATSDAMTIELPQPTLWASNSVPPIATLPGKDHEGGVHCSKSRRTSNIVSQYPTPPLQTDYQHSTNGDHTAAKPRRASSATSQRPYVRSGSSSSVGTSASRERHRDDDGDSAGIGYTNAKDWLLSLHVASYRGHAAIIPGLLERDVDVNERDRNGRTALHQAAMKDHVAVVKLLLQHGADINAADNKGQTALHWGALQKNGPMLRVLIDAGAEVNAIDHNGWTPLHAAVERVFEAGVRLLLRHGGDLSYQSPQV